MTNSFLPNVLLCKWCATSTASTPLGLTRPVDPCAGRSPLYAVACPIRRQRQRRGVLYLHFVSNAPSGSMPPANCDCDTQRVGGRIFRRRRILASSTGRSTNSRRISTFNGTGQQSNSPKANWPKRIRPRAFFCGVAISFKSPARSSTISCPPTCRVGRAAVATMSLSEQSKSRPLFTVKRRS